MATLVLHAPHSRFRGAGETFDEMVDSGIARGYAIPSTLVSLVNTGCVVVLLDKEKGRRAEGRFKQLKPVEKAGNGQQRYDVYFEEAVPVNYLPERLTRSGVAVI